MERSKTYRQGAMLLEHDPATCLWAQLAIIEQGSLALAEHLHRNLADRGAVKSPGASKARFGNFPFGTDGMTVF